MFLCAINVNIKIVVKIIFLVKEFFSIKEFRKMNSIIDSSIFFLYFCRLEYL